MDSPWFGGIIMLVVVLGSVVWGWWAMKQGKKESKEE